MARPAASPIEESERRISLSSGSLSYILRRTPRARGLRLSVDGRHGLLVTVPPATRRGWARPDERIETFIRERERWIRRHLGRFEREQAEAAARGGATDGGLVHYRGELHRVRVMSAPLSARRSNVERAGDDGGDELVVRLAPRDRRSVPRVLETWFRERAAAAIEHAVAIHAGALGVTVRELALRDPRTRWGSASKNGRLMLSWRLVLAPPGSLETVVVHELAHLRVFGHGPRFWKLVASRRPSHLADRAWLRTHSHALHSALDTRRDAA